MPQRTWFITGINSGFGRELTEQLLHHGDRVAGTVRTLGSTDDLSAEYGDRLWVAHLDVTDTDEIKAVVSRAFRELGPIDVVVNNAGYGLFGAAEEVSDAQIAHVIDTNLIGSIQVARAALPHLRRQGHGRIIQMSSVAGQTAMPGASLYQASKWGIEGFMDALAQEVAGFGIGVTIIEPGGARTNFRHGSLQLGEPLSDYDGSPAAMVRAIQQPEHESSGDPVKIAAAVIRSVDQTPAPRRVVLGSDSFGAIKAALTARLAAHELQRDLASSTDFSSAVNL
ncbi:MAG: SDR family oxidoreductase [Pseudolysinimonas sp.]|uniref:SDR family oxidoreductase n=1 Tax=Pseudolysinimonas sp. TaxID=2680009 RepID=UPI003264055E